MTPSPRSRTRRGRAPSGATRGWRKCARGCTASATGRQDRATRGKKGGNGEGAGPNGQQR
eukprot:2950855-Prymnesium_polylepis.1